MIAILEKLYENRRDRVSIAELRGLCSELFMTVFGSTNIEMAIIAFGTFLEAMQLHPTIAERWLTTATTHPLFTLAINETNEKNEESMPRYQTFGTIQQSRWDVLCLCCHQWTGCEDTENLNENGLTYKYSIFQRIDRLVEKYLSLPTLTSLDDNQLYTAIWKMVNEFYIDTNKNITGTLYGIYVSIQTIKNLCTASLNETTMKIVNGYIKHFLKCEQIVGSRSDQQDDIQFIYGKYSTHSTHST